MNEKYSVNNADLDDYSDQPLPDSLAIVGIDNEKVIPETLTSENLGIYELIKTLQALNPYFRISGEWDTEQPYIVSSIDVSLLILPPGYYYDEKIGLNNRSANNIDSYERYDIDVQTTSTIDKIHGKNSDTEHKYMSTILDYSQNNSVFLPDHELQKAPEQIEQIEHVISLVNDDRVRRGKNKLFIDSRFIHIYDKEEWKNSYKERNNGVYSQIWQACNICEQKSKIRLLGTVAHELYHSESYNEVKMDEEIGLVTPYRVGLGVWKDGKWLAGSITEAINQERTRDLMQYELANNPYYADEANQSQAIEAQYPDLMYTSLDSGKPCYKIFCELGAIAVTVDANGETIISGDSYREERRTFRKLIRILSKKSGLEFDEIHSIFCNAQDSGDVKKLANLIENTLGAGNFKQLYEQCVDADSFERYVDSL